MSEPWVWVLLLAAVGAYGVWRSVAHFRKKRPAFGIVLAFLALFCFYEAVMRSIELLGSQR